MNELFLSRSENNKRLKQLPICDISFECKQKRMSSKKFWDNYVKLEKYTRMRCILCNSGLTEIPIGKDGD